MLTQNISISKNDDLEQYGRRTSLRIDGLEFNEDETVSQCEEKVKKFIKDDLKLNVTDDEFDRIHRIGKALINDINGNLAKSFDLEDFGALMKRNIYSLNQDFSENPKVI